MQVMNYSYRHHPSLVGLDDRFSPSSTPSPPVYHPKCRPAFLPYFHPHKFLPQAPRARKRGFTIEELLGIGEREVREVYDATGYKAKQYPDATPRSALTALLPQSPEKSSTEKYDSKTLCKPRQQQPDDPESTTALYDILSPPKPAPKSPPSHGGGGGKMKRIRTIFTPEQLERLEAEFERQQYMVGPERLYLASTLNLSESQVKIWFQNRRIKWRKQHLEMQQARLAQMREGGSPPGEQQDPLSPNQQWDE